MMYLIFAFVFVGVIVWYVLYELRPGWENRLCGKPGFDGWTNAEYWVNAEKKVNGHTVWRQYA